MNAIINPRTLDPDMRPKVRRELRARIQLTMVEVFGWGPYGDRWHKLDDFAQQFMAKYDTLYPNPRDEHAAMLNRVKAAGISHGYKKGSGLKVEYAHEHDIVFLPYLLGLRKLFGFGQDRLKQFLTGVNSRTDYYNKTFAGESDEVMPVIENKLERYGRKPKKA